MGFQCSEECQKPQPPLLLKKYCNTPAICTAIRLQFVLRCFWCPHCNHFGADSMFGIDCRGLGREMALCGVGRVLNSTHCPPLLNESESIFSVKVPLFQGTSTPYDPSFYDRFWEHIFWLIWGVGVVETAPYTIFSVKVPFFQGSSTPYDPSFYGIFLGASFLLIWGWGCTRVKSKLF